jgi:cytochrome c peroxidase
MGRLAFLNFYAPRPAVAHKKGPPMQPRLATSVLAASLIGLPLPAPAATTTINQAGQAFSETDITLKAGDHIKFLNSDSVNHNILIQSGDDDDDAKDLGVQPPGSSVDALFDKAGKFKVRCHIHPSMKLNVEVQ